VFGLLYRHGYKFIFLERQQLLAFMYEAQPDKSKLLPNKKLEKIEEDKDGVKVTTTDGSVYEGDIVVGADGVWSSVREHMWKEMEKDEKLTTALEEDRQGKCLVQRTSWIFMPKLEFNNTLP
jgi:2-polyprenyl-6-methoxyphenol hydroxylase-like FAD-dependent oxidoreductase